MGLLSVRPVVNIAMHGDGSRPRIALAVARQRRVFQIELEGVDLHHDVAQASAAQRAACIKNLCMYREASKR